METLQYGVKKVVHSYRGANSDLCSVLGECPICHNPLTGSHCDTCSTREGGNGNCWCGARAIGPHGYCADHL